MFTRGRITVACAFLSALTVFDTTVRANVLVNGSFESWSGGYTPGNQPDRIFNDGSLKVTGWNFAIGLSSDLYRDQNAGSAQSNYYRAADGDYLAGSGSFFSLHEGISQTFTAVPDTYYALTFQMAPGGLNYDGSWIEHATVSSAWLVQVTGAVASGVNNSYPTNLADFDSSAATNPLNWTSQYALFKSDAVGGSVTVAFYAYGDLTHVFLDNVVVEIAHVPEPSAWVLGIVGAMGTLAWRLRRID